MDNMLVLASRKPAMSTSQSMVPAPGSPIVTRNSPAQRSQPSMKIEDALKMPVETIRAQALDAMGRLSMLSPRLGGLLLLAVKLYPQMSLSNQAKVTYLASRAKHSGMLDGCPCGGSLAGYDDDFDSDWGDDGDDDNYNDGQNQSGAAGQSTNVQKTSTAASGMNLNSVISSFLNAGANVATSAIQQQAAADIAAKKAALDAAKQKTAANIQQSSSAAKSTGASAAKKPTKRTAPTGFFAKHWGKILVGTVVVTASGVGTAWYLKKKKESK